MAVKRNPDGTLAKGSGALNPGGRPKVAGKVRELARVHGSRAIDRLAELLDDPDGRVVVAAAKELLDRGFGKPMQQVKKTVTHVKRSPRELSLEEIEKRIAELGQGAMQ